MQGDHLYTIKKRREASSPGPTIHEIHPSEMLDNVQIIETPVMEVVADSPVMCVFIQRTLLKFDVGLN